MIIKNERPKKVTIQHVPFFVIPAFSGDRKGDGEMPESRILHNSGREIPVFFAIPLSWNGEKTGMTINAWPDFCERLQQTEN